LSFVLLAVGCREPFEIKVTSSVNLVVVDGGITNLPEKQVIKLSRSTGDSLTGIPISQAISSATVELVIDSVNVVPFQQIADGFYQLPERFQGIVGHRYQLRFKLEDGTQYASTVETMQPVPLIEKIYDRFNPQSISTDQTGTFVAANDLFLNTNDPANVRNFYRWDWILWERQEICHSCTNGMYYVYDAKGNLVEDCIPEPRTPGAYYETYYWDYRCRMRCWDVFSSYSIDLFADTYTNGGPLTGRRVAQIPFYQSTPALVEIRQSSLTQGAYRYYKLLADQTQNTGGLADTPPSPSIGNVRNITNEKEQVIGYFTVSALSKVRHWLDRANNTGAAIGLFYAINRRNPRVEEASPIQGRPPLAICIPSENRTPIKPEGWRD